jgi:hypothetical protein
MRFWVKILSKSEETLGRKGEYILPKKAGKSYDLVIQDGAKTSDPLEINGFRGFLRSDLPFVSA